MGCSPWGRESQTRLSDFTFTFHFHALVLQTFRSQSEVFSPLPAGGLWLAFPSEAYSVLNRKAQTSTMPSTEKMLSMLPVTIVATTEKQSSIYEDIFLRPRLQQSMGISS